MKRRAVFLDLNGTLEKLMKSHGYVRIHSWQQDDFYVPAPRQ